MRLIKLTKVNYLDITHYLSNFVSSKQRGVEQW